MKVGLDGERNRIYSETGSSKVDWNNADKEGPVLTWYKVQFNINLIESYRKM